MVYITFLQKNRGLTFNDYPPALDPKDKAIDEADDLVKLTEQSLIIGKKPKARPVVVKLNDADLVNVATKKAEFKEDLISGAVQEVLLGNEATTSSTRKKESNRSSKRPEVGELDESKSNIIKTDRSGKEKKHRSSGKHKEHNHKDKQKSDSKHKSRHRAQRAVEAQASVVPDFLL